MRRRSRARTRAPSRRATARSRRSCRRAATSDGIAARRRARQPPQADPAAILDRAQQRARVGRPRDVLVCRSSRGASAPHACRVRALAQHETALVVERALRCRTRGTRARGRPANSAACASSVPVPAVSTRLRRVARSTVTMSRWLIIRGSGPRSAVSAISRPSGAMSKSLGARLPRRQREAGAGERVAAAAGRDVADEDVRLAAVGEPVVPEAELGALGDVRLDLRVLALLPALRLHRVGREVRPHPRDERDPLAVGEPLDRGAAGRERREPPRLAAVGRDQVDLRLLVVLALRGERDRIAVGRPLRIAVLVARGEPARLRARTCRRGPSGTARARSRCRCSSMSKRRHRGAGERAVRRERRRARCA